MWQALYESSFWLPILPSLTALAWVVMTSLRPPRRIAYVFGGVTLLAIVLDAWLNGAWSPLAGGAATAAGVTFVILGDARYFLAQRLACGMPWRRAALHALALALVVPLASQLAVRVPFPDVSSRVLFLIYEAMALVWIALDAWRHREHPRALVAFELTQYALWILADVLLLASCEWAYALRIVPNVMYYCAFVPFAVRVVSVAGERLSPPTRAR